MNMTYGQERVEMLCLTHLFNTVSHDPICFNTVSHDHRKVFYLQQVISQHLCCFFSNLGWKFFGTGAPCCSLFDTLP